MLIGRQRMLRRHVSEAILLQLLALMASIPLCIRPVEASDVIYIRTDGSIDPAGASIFTVDNITYVMTGNIHNSIVVEKNDTVLDGADHTIFGTGELNAKGIMLSERYNVTIKNTNIVTFYYGIYLYKSSNNTISVNDITNCEYSIWLSGSSNNNISANHVISNDHGIVLTLLSNHNVIQGNRISNNTYGIRFDYISEYNNVTANNIANNQGGALLMMSSNNQICYNNFIGNSAQTLIPGHFPNTWDNGYPYGGNYWSDYTGVDLFSGSGQNETGGDMIGDTPYTIDASNQDRYPLMKPHVQCDLNDDGYVDVRDIFIVARAYGSYIIHPRWNYLADINDDRIVDIRDIYIVSKNYGKRYS